MSTHRLFVYGTLKRGQPNYSQMESENGVAEFVGMARTVKKWPLVIASSVNIPYLLDVQGTGNHVLGEIFNLDEKMLAHCNAFERCPDYYQRTTIQVQLIEDSAGSKVEDGKVEDVLVYIIRGFRDFMMELPQFESYDSKGDHGLVYKARFERLDADDHFNQVLKTGKPSL